jgi:hypothetical protein
MNPEFWKLNPETTNPEEAMHWKLYSAIGRSLPLFEGLRGHNKFMQHYQELSDVAAGEWCQFFASKQRDLDGVKIFYGRDRQSWKRAAANFGYIKYTRHHGPRGLLGKTKPPDTGKALMGARKRRPPVAEYEKSYQWKDNSCWLDSSLTIISVPAARDYTQSMEPRLRSRDQIGASCGMLADSRGYPAVR